MSALIIAVASALSMLARFTTYIVADYQPIDAQYACFRSENTMGNDEKGVRPNADLSMVSAFLCRYAKDKVELPANVSWQQLDTMALKTLRYAVNTHKAVRKKACAGGNYWGSVSVADHKWESSLWALSVAYSAYFQWDKLSDTLRSDLYKLLRAECNYELERNIPTGYRYDTKSEENGWEVGVLAAALGLFPDDELAPRWFERMREFAINSYSHPSDSTNNDVIDPWYNQQTVADLYRGANLYTDWTLQNHGFFHTSYQNVVIQELGEAALALKLFQSGRGEKWRSRALLHNCDSVANNVLNWLTLPDGEQAMPNGNDWSLFLYDQVTSYSTLACQLRDTDALLFEGRAMEQIARRQLTTPDGSWLLRPDVGARRMGVEAHRVMMSWLMHQVYPTTDLQPSNWDDFAQRYSEAKLFPCQRIVRTLGDRYFACFSFSEGKRSYTGYIAPLNQDNNNLVVPYRKYNTGNLVGYYETEGKNCDAKLVTEPQIETEGRWFTVKATLAENDSSLLRSFTLTTKPSGLEYQDHVVWLLKVPVRADKTGLLAISTDEFTRQKRLIEFGKGTTVVDNLLIVNANSKAQAAWADTTTDNSITTTKLYPFINAKPLRSHKMSIAVR